MKNNNRHLAIIIKLIYNRLQFNQYSIVDRFEKSNSFLYRLQFYL